MRKALCNSDAKHNFGVYRVLLYIIKFWVTDDINDRINVCSNYSKGDDFEEEEVHVPLRERLARRNKQITYNYGEDSEED